MRKVASENTLSYARDCLYVSECQFLSEMSLHELGHVGVIPCHMSFPSSGPCMKRISAPDASSLLRRSVGRHRLLHGFENLGFAAPAAYRAGTNNADHVRISTSSPCSLKRGAHPA